MNQNHIFLMVADVVIDITTNNIKAHGLIQERFSNFIFPSKSHVDMTLNLALDRLLEKRSMAQEYQLNFLNDKISIDYPDGNATLDFTLQLGELRLTGNNFIVNLEYTLRIIVAWYIFSKGGMLLHSAAVKDGGKGFIFCGHSGAGKSTIVKNSPGKLPLGDDLVIVMLSFNNSWQVYSTPFHNPDTDQPALETAVLDTIFFISQSKRNYIQEISILEAMAEIISNVPIINAIPIYHSELIDRSKQFLKTIKFARLFFTPDPTFWQIVTK